MATQLKRGGKVIMEHFYSTLAYIDHYALDDPASVRRLTQELRDQFEEDFKPLLMRAEPTLEARVKAIEDHIGLATNVTPFRKEG